MHNKYYYADIMLAFFSYLGLGLFFRNAYFHHEFSIVIDSKFYGGYILLSMPCIVIRSTDRLFQQFKETRFGKYADMRLW